MRRIESISFKQVFTPRVHLSRRFLLSETSWPGSPVTGAWQALPRPILLVQSFYLTVTTDFKMSIFALIGVTIVRKSQKLWWLAGNYSPVPQRNGDVDLNNSHILGVEYYIDGCRNRYLCLRYLILQDKKDLGIATLKHAWQRKAWLP